MNIATHTIASEEIMAFLDAELSAERAQFVAAHIEECPRCGNFANEQRETSGRIGNWAVPVAPRNKLWEDSLRESVRQVVSKPRLVSSSRVGSFLRRRWLVVACPVALVAVVLTRVGLAPPRAEWGKDSRIDVQLGPARTHTVRALPDPVARPVPKPPAGGVASGADTSDTNGSLGYQVADGALYSAGKDQEEEQVKGVGRFSMSEPMIARMVSLSILAKDFTSSRATLDAILARHHGYAASLTANTQQNSARSVQASLRIPAGELSAAIAELKSLGQVQSETQGGEEVTQQHADLVARLKNSRETERRLQAILEQRTGKVSDVLAVEQEIARVRGEIEQMEAEQKSLEHRVSFASVELTLAEEYKAQINLPAPAISTRIHNAMVAGYRDAVENLVGIVLWFASNGPSFLIWVAFLAPIAWFARRRWLRASVQLSSAVQ